MDFYNQSPFPFQSFATLAPSGVLHWVCVLKATCSLDGNDNWSADGASIQYADEYFGAPALTSIRRPNDIAPFKPKSDVVFVDAVAHAPGNAELPTWPVTIDIGKINVRLNVVGPRHWSRNMFGAWRLSEAEPVTQVALIFENAYGGLDGSGNAFEANPVGKGFRPPQSPKSESFSSAPQVFFSSDSVNSPTHRQLPAGVGATSPAWLPRRPLAGTYDQHWKNNVWPILPSDFHYRFHNVAPKHLQADDYFRGDETICLDGLADQGPVRRQLPGGLNPGLLMPRSGGGGSWARLNMDTLLIDMSARRIEAVFRACFIPPDHTQRAEIVPNVPQEVCHA